MKDSFDPDSPVREAADKQLDELLNLYEPPAPSLLLDQRVLMSYRAQQSRSGGKRVWALLTTSVRVPVPLAAAVLLAMIAAIAWAMNQPIPSPLPAMEPLDPAPLVRVVEVPVVQDKIVTRTVYLRRKSVDRSETADRSKAGRPNGSSLALFSSGDENGYVVQQTTDLRGFQPVPELKIRVIRRTDTNED